MTKILRLTLLLTALCAVMAGKAENVTDYKQAFDIAFSTAEHDFAVGSSWLHLVDNHNDGFVRYKYHETGGIDNSGYLEIGSQLITDYDIEQDFTLNDLLVTPPITGKSSLMVKKANSWSSDAGVRFYKVNEAGGILTRGEEITPAVYDLNVTDYQKVELPAVPAGTRIGIRGYYVNIDNFTADEADINYRNALDIVSAEWNGGRYVDCDVDGNYQLSYLVTLKNVGDYTLTPSTPNYSIALKRNTLNTVIATQSLTDTLKPGSTISTVFKITLNKKAYAHFDGYLQENISNDSTALARVTPNDYAPSFKITGAYGDIALQTGNRIEYGTSRDTVTVNFLLKNRGALPQNLTELSTTPGFKASLKAPLTIAAHDSIPVSVSMTPDITGEKHGHLVIKGDNGVNLTLHLNGYSVSSDEYFVDMENDSLPEGFSVPDAWRLSSFPQDIYSINNKNCLSYYDSNNKPSKLITPLLEVKQGERLSFEVSKENNHSFINLYVSKDRHNWVRIDSIGASEMSDSILRQTWTGYDYAFKRITTDKVPAGRWYIAFEAGHAYLDNILGLKPILPEADAFIDNANIPAQGQVNTPLATSATLKNTLYKPTGTGYKLSLYVDGKPVAEAPATSLNAMGNHDVKLSFTPHTAGTFKAFYKFEQGGTVITSDTVSVTIAPETTESETSTGTKEWRWEGVPLDLYKFQSESEVIYLASELNLNPGTQITRLSYYGTSMADFSPKVTVWLENTTDTAFTPPYTYTPSEQMTKVYDFFADVKRISEADANAGPVMELQLVKPFVYTGGNLRVKMMHSCNMGVVVAFDGIGSVTLPRRSISCSNDSDLTKAPISENFVPIMRVGFTATTRLLKGKATDLTTGKGIEGATVTVRSGDVLYTGTTLDDGSYAVPVIKDNLIYQIEIARDGYFPFRMDNVSFTEATVEKNVSLKTADGFYIDELQAPVTAEVNKPYNVTAKATNYLPTNLSKDDYTARLYFGADYKDAPTCDVTVKGQGSYAFAFYPHHAGSYKACVVLRINGGARTVSDTINVNVVDEQGTRTVQVADSTSTQFNAPVTMNFKKSQTETLYPASKLNLTAGTLIKAINYHGYITANNKSYDAKVSVWVANADEESYSGTFTAADTTQMARVFSGTVTYRSGGNATAPITLLSVPFDTPFVYQGKSLRVVVQSLADDYMIAQFISDNTLTDNSYYRATDYGELTPRTWNKAGGYASAAPVAWLNVDPTQVVSGRITDNAGNGVNNATVTLTSGEVVYTGTTLADGTFSINIIQSDKTYTASVRAEGYQDAMSAVNPGESLNIVLEPTGTDDIRAVQDAHEGYIEYYDLNGRRVSTPHTGVYIVKMPDGTTRKVVIK